MPQCCGQEVTTPYCPTCGAKHGKTPAGVELLRYLRQREKTAKGKTQPTWTERAAWVEKVIERLAPVTTGGTAQKGGE